MLNCRAMNATTPDRETAPPRRVSLVLHPRRDVQHAIDQVTAWAQRTGTELAAVDDGRLPAEVRRCEIGELAHGCDLVLALGGDGTMLGGLRLAAPLGVPVLGANLGRLGYLTEVDGEHLPQALEAWPRAPTASRSASCCAPPGRRTARARAGRLQRRRPRPRPGARPGPAGPARRRPAPGPLRQRRRHRRHADRLDRLQLRGRRPDRLAQTRAMIITPDAPHGLFNRAVVLGAEDAWASTSSRRARRSRSRSTGGCSWRPSRAGASDQPNHGPRCSSAGPAGFAERARRKLGITDPAALAN